MSLDTTQLAKYKELLKKEQARITEELATVGHQNPNALGDWQANPDEMDIMQADRNEVADRNEELIDNVSILNELEIRFNRVKRALEKIEAGTYGVCEVGGEFIATERLDANPAAMTCIDHATKLHE